MKEKRRGRKRKRKKGPKREAKMQLRYSLFFMKIVEGCTCTRHKRNQKKIDGLVLR